MIRKHTTQTKNLAAIILKDLAVIQKVEIQCDSNTIEEVKIEDFKRDVILFAQSGIFTDAVEWRYVTDGEIIIVSAVICPSVGTELKIHMKADEETVQALNETIFDKATKNLENNHIQR